MLARGGGSRAARRGVERMRASCMHARADLLRAWHRFQRFVAVDVRRGGGDLAGAEDNRIWKLVVNGEEGRRWVGREREGRRKRKEKKRKEKKERREKERKIFIFELAQVYKTRFFTLSFFQN